MSKDNSSKILSELRDINLKNENNRQSRPTKRAESIDNKKKRSFTPRLVKYKTTGCLYDEENYKRLKEKMEDFKKVISTINEKEPMKGDILQSLINIHDILKNKIPVLLNNSDTLINKNSINEGAAPKSILKSGKKSPSSNGPNLPSEKSNFSNSNHEMTKDDYDDFLNRVTCPFCSDVLKNKIYLIKHLDESCSRQNLTSRNNIMPFSYFQILSGNRIKCNVCPTSIFENFNIYLAHLNSEEHAAKSKIISRRKSCTNDLFCSVCKILVPNNFTEMIFHLQHSYNANEEKEFSIAAIVKQKVTCLLRKNKTLKCLACSLIFDEKQNNFEAFYKHIKEADHFKNMKIYLQTNCNKVYCENCKDTIKLTQISNHLQCSEKETIKFCLCYYCGNKFCDLINLDEHMKSKCVKIKVLKIEEPLLQKKDLNNLNQMNISDSKNIQQKSNIDIPKRHLIVKGQENIREVFLFFKKYGEVATVNKLNETTLIIEFLDDKIIERILNLKQPLQINGVNVEISTDYESELNSLKANRKIHESSDDNDSDEDNSLRDNNEDQYLINNFNKLIKEIVPLSFLNEKKNFNYESIIEDCKKNFNCTSCSVVGFQSCHLCGPEDELSLFCDLEMNFFQKLFMTEKNFTLNIISETYVKLSNSNDWVESFIKIEPIPLIKCKHKETGKICNIFFSKSIEKLSKMFSDFVNDKENVLCFFLFIKCWLQYNQMKTEEFELEIISLGLFYLSSQFNMSLSMNPENIHLQISELVEKDDPSLKASISNSTSLASMEVRDLVLKFWNFMFRFDFDKYAICLPLNFPVSKIILTKVNTSLPSVDSSSFCIMDPFLQYNLANNFKIDQLKYFLVKLGQRLLL